MIIQDVSENVNEQAFQFGVEDALEEQGQRGSTLFVICSDAWHSYNDGYAAGCATLFDLTGRNLPVWNILGNFQKN